MNNSLTFKYQDIGHPLITVTPEHVLTFCSDGEVIGQLKFKHGHLSFDGNADESAKAFLDCVAELFMEKAPGKHERR